VTVRLATTRAALALLVLGVLVAACGGSDGGDGSTASRSSGSTPAGTGARPSTDATLAILSPKNGATIQGSSVPLRLSLKGGTIAATASTELVPDEGHLHVVLDDRLISMTSDLDSVIDDVAPGTHLLKVEFVANDHAPFDPRVIAAVSFEVTA
jgi:hypothetical protein